MEEWRQARRVVTVALGTGARRGELLGLRWRDVELLEGRVTIREAFVRGTFQTPKSRKSMQTFGLGPIIVHALNEQWQDTAYKGDTDLVFCHAALGSPLDPSKLSRASTCGRRSRKPELPNPSGPSTTCGTQRSRTTPSSTTSRRAASVLSGFGVRASASSPSRSPRPAALR
jgi:hypothetical protein